MLFYDGLAGCLSGFGVLLLLDELLPYLLTLLLQLVLPDAVLLLQKLSDLLILFLLLYSTDGLQVFLADQLQIYILVFGCLLEKGRILFPLVMLSSIVLFMWKREMLPVVDFFRSLMRLSCLVWQLVLPAVLVHSIDLFLQEGGAD